MRSKLEQLKAWVLDRFGLRSIDQAVLRRKVPKTPWYYGDGASLFTLFGVLALTGAAMAFFYSPTPETAYASVRYITDEAPLGWFVRGLHYWAAGLMMVMAWFHLFRVIMVGGYKFPREGTWLIGVLLLFCIFTMAFIGYLLRWDENAVYATTLVLHMFKRTPFIGEWLVRLIQGGEELGARTLSRVFAAHVIWFPALMLMLIGYHLYLVITKGVTSRAEKEQPVIAPELQEEIVKHEIEQGEEFYPVTVAKSGLMSLIVFFIVVGLALTISPPTYREANLVEPSMPQEEWWYWWFSGLIALVPSVIAPSMAIVLPLLLFITLVLLPFIDRNPYRGISFKRRPVVMSVVVVSICVLIWLSVQRVRSPWTGWPTGELPPVPAGVVLSPTGEEGRVIYNQYGCNSCHAIAGHGPQIGPDIQEISELYTRDRIVTGILAPPANSSMPLNYGERMTPDEVEKLVQFIEELSGSHPSSLEETTGAAGR